MISLFADFVPSPEDQLPADVQAIFDDFAKLVAHDYAAAKDLLWKHALTVANGGTMPSLDEIRENAVEVISKGGVSHLLWGHPKIKLGDSVDLSYEIASIDPPLKNQ